MDNKQENANGRGEGWVKALAEAACIALSDEELRDLTVELSALMDALSSVGENREIEEGSAWRQTAVPEEALREDEPAPSLSREEFLSAAEREAEGFFAVPLTLANRGGAE